ncbi:MAG: DegT/DnrJ/EryC1/StrS family aminotransferase [Acidobacteria bacterium]|nr:DegT/DnrJ/EryC1/StrS family aminotransferase [Acidobacteriota bacterium]
MRRRQLLSLPAMQYAAETAKATDAETVPSWPVFDEREEDSVTRVLKSAKWGRGNGTAVASFEERYANLTGAKHCLAVANGTSALIVALGVLGIGPGDEVIVPPYTFIATVNAVLRFNAIPIFADIDPATLQMDPKRVEEQITPRTRAIIMVHMAGGVGELGQVIEIGRKRNIPVIEDAAQAHLAEWQGKHVGPHGTLGCFSFQASKNLNSGEGGAVVTNDSALAEKAFAFHNNSRGRTQPGTEFHYEMSGANLRLTEFQGALLTAQMSRIESQALRRAGNAKVLDQMLGKVDGLTPYRVAKDCTRNAYHLYMFRYDAAKFGGKPRAAFLKAMAQHKVPASAGYAPLQDEPFLQNTFDSRGYEFAYGKNYFRKWRKRNDCPVNRKACGEAVWFTQNLLLGEPALFARIEKAIAAWVKMG